MMINSLELKNFKSFEELNIDLGKLTVLTGLNGSGKSSILHAITLLKQSLESNIKEECLVLNGSWLTLGNSDDILYERAQENQIEINLNLDNECVKFKCNAIPEIDILPLEITGSILSAHEALSHFQLIQADRLIPAIQYMKMNSIDISKKNLGSRGEFTVDFLKRNEDLKVSTGRHYPKERLSNPEDKEFMKSIAPTDSLLDLTTEWLQLLSPGARPKLQSVDLADLTSLRYEYKGILGDVGSRDYRPSNVGFGLTYSLPILVSCLAAKKGALLLLENPEAHLHPRGQSALGLLLSLCAADGVQIIVETHSDHLLNGIRLAAKRKYINSADVNVHFFSRDPRTGITGCESPRLLDNGRFDDWPNGFFDEWGNALEELLEE